MTRKRWDAYVKEASKPPFELEVEDGKVIAVEVPTGEQLIKAQRLAALEADAEEQLRVICGPAADDILPLVKAAPGGVMTQLVQDIMEHFGYAAGEAPTPT